MKTIFKSVVVSTLFATAFVLSKTSGYHIKTDNQKWTTSYEILFSKKEREKHARSKEIYVEKKDIVSGTQIVFGWNAIRPEKAQITFYIKLHNAVTKEWSSYHKLVEWGGKSQISFANKNEFSNFLYARLEISKNTIIDGFAIQVTADDSKALGLVEGLFVTIADFKQFVPQKIDSSFFKRKYLCIENVPSFSQILLLHPRAGGICSPTSTAIVSSYLLGKKVDPLEFADYCYDRALDIFGNWAFSTAHAFEKIHKVAYMYPMRLGSIESLYDLIQDQHSPVVVSVKGTLQGAPKKYPNGHLLVVIGFDPARKKVICLDPASREIEKVRREYDLQDFINAWEWVFWKDSPSPRMTYKVLRK